MPATTALTAVPDPTVDTDTPRCDLNLPVLRRRRGKVTRLTLTFTAYATTDAASVLRMMAGKNEAQQVGGLQQFLFRSLVDDDTVSHEAVPRLVPDTELDDTNDTASTEVATTDDQVVGPSQWRLVWPDDNGNPGPELATDPKTDEVFPPHGTLLELQAWARDNSSSLRRFVALMDDPYDSMLFEDLFGAVQQVAEAATGRPTKPSKPSSGSRRTKAR